MGNADDDGYRSLPQLCFQCGGTVPWGDSHGEGVQRLGGDCPASHRVFRGNHLGGHADLLQTAAERLCLLAQFLRCLGQHGEHRDLLKGGAVRIRLQSCFQGGQRQLVHPQGAGQRVTLQKVDIVPLAHDDPRLGTTQQFVPGEG